jgi:hypothetical protein
MLFIPYDETQSTLLTPSMRGFLTRHAHTKTNVLQIEELEKEKLKHVKQKTLSNKPLISTRRAITG